MTFLKTISLISISVLFCASVSAETSLSLELPILTVAGEFGTTTSPNDYVSVSLYAGADAIFGGGVNWVRSAASNDSHWFGAGVGHMSDNNDNSIISFDVGTYGSLDYKYFKNGLSGSGFYFYTSVRGVSDGVFPWLGFGYNW